MSELLSFDEERLRSAFAGRRVLVTGHTGFKGGWLTLWLHRLGALVTGVALPPPEDRPSLFEALRLESLIDHRIADLRHDRSFAAATIGVDAEIVFHLAAQPLVRRSYEIPAETFLVNVVGTARVLDAVQSMPSLRAAVVITSDKCYENEEWPWGYREADRMGGADPYSASKGCAELLVSSYRRCFFSDAQGPALASARAGNVVGGGDWSSDRLVPDIMRAALARQPVHIRNPGSIRPWQHVLDPLAGYLQLAARLLEEGPALAEGWNFGPDSAGTVDVGTLVDEISRTWEGGIKVSREPAGNAPHEAGILCLDSSKARTRLGWRPRLSLSDTVGMTVDWYRAHAGGGDMHAFSMHQIDRYWSGETSDRRTKSPVGVTSEAA
jgi:CDP-glucose 4,6-dehydratase